MPYMAPSVDALSRRRARLGAKIGFDTGQSCIQANVLKHVSLAVRSVAEGSSFGLNPALVA